MSLNGNTNELNEILDLAKSIEVPTIKSISVNGVAQTPDANKNVDIQIPKSGSELTLMGETTLDTNASVPYSFTVPLNDTLTKNDLVYVTIGYSLYLIGSLYSQKEVISNAYDTGEDVYIDKFIATVGNRLDTGKGQVSFSMSQQKYDGYIGTVKVYVQKNALTFSE